MYKGVRRFEIIRSTFTFSAYYANKRSFNEKLNKLKPMEDSRNKVCPLNDDKLNLVYFYHIKYSQSFSEAKIILHWRLCTKTRVRNAMSFIRTDLYKQHTSEYSSYWLYPFYVLVAIRSLVGTLNCIIKNTPVSKALIY